MKEKSEKIGDALLKVALGYQVAEVTEEYAEVDGDLKLTKRKRTKKDVPPDLKAVQLLLAERGGADVSVMTDEELKKEKKRLLFLLEKEREETGQVCDEETIQEVKRKRPKPRKRVQRKIEKE